VISARAAAERKGVDLHTIHMAIKRGEIIAVKVGVRWQIDEESIKDWKRKNRRLGC
jgi:excisionase family DNA binding protein